MVIFNSYVSLPEGIFTCFHMFSLCHPAILQGQLLSDVGSLKSQLVDSIRRRSARTVAFWRRFSIMTHRIHGAGILLT